jgi:hypothetical protein
MRPPVGRHEGVHGGQQFLYHGICQTRIAEAVRQRAAQFTRSILDLPPVGRRGVLGLMTTITLSADQADFALKILEAFGDARFTLSDYFVRIERSRHQRLPDPGQNQRHARDAQRAHLGIWRIVIRAGSPRRCRLETQSGGCAGAATTRIGAERPSR